MDLEHILRQEVVDRKDKKAKQEEDARLHAQSREVAGLASF